MPEQSFMKSLFHGVIAEELAFPWPEIAAADRDKLQRVSDDVRKLAADHVDAAWIDAKSTLPEAVRRGVREIGLLGARIPTDLGGLGLSTVAHARLMQEVASIDGSLALTLLAHDLGHQSLLLFGSDAQKRRYLPKIARDGWLCAFALTEPLAGSDAASMHTRAEPTRDGEGYVLRGEKAWILNGGDAQLFSVFARTSADALSKPHIAAFLVERAHGVTSSDEVHTSGMRGASMTAIRFDGAAVPAANLIGEPGRGFRVAVEALNRGRLGIGAACVGMTKKVVARALAHAEQRRAFGRPIGQFGLTKDKLGGMMVDLFALESVVHLTAGIVDARVAEDSLESAICKVMGCETLIRATQTAMSIVAGPGFVAGSPWERGMRDAQAFLTYGGTNDILRCFIALAGMAGPGREITEVSRAMREPIKGFGLLSDFAIRKARSALGRERLHRVHPLLNKETVLFEEVTAELTRNVDKVLRKHGKEIAEMQFTQRRIADLASDLFGIAACLSRTSRAIERKGEEGARREIELTTAFAARAEQRMGAIVRAFERNDDELLKGIAARATIDGGYPLDVLL
ncbi:MAG: acyl-CoA dehydrogenase family protein [Polyangiales bacterium]